VRHKQLHQRKSIWILRMVIPFLFTWEKFAHCFFSMRPRQLVLPATVFQFVVFMLALAFEPAEKSIAIGIIGNLLIVAMAMLPGMLKQRQEG
jgi:hypothetical protein